MLLLVTYLLGVVITDLLALFYLKSIGLCHKIMSVDLKPARLLETFEVQENGTNDVDCVISSEAAFIGCGYDSFHIDTLDNIPAPFHYLFDAYLANAYIFKLIDLFNHLTIMREEFEYNNQDIYRLNVCIKTVYKFMHNISTHPDKEKYRRIRESNRTFQKKIGQVKGSQLLLKLCGWVYIEMDKTNQQNGSYSSIYVFESSITIEFIECVVEFLNEYMKHPNIRIIRIHQKNVNNVTDITCAEDTETKEDVPSKPIGPITKADIVRKHRLKNFGDVQSLSTKIAKSKCNGVGPKLGADFNKSKYSLPPKQNMRRSKHFNMNDIRRMRKEDFDREAAGPKVKSMMDTIGVNCLELTNEFRVKMGLQPLKWHQALCEIAKTHSRNMGQGAVPLGHEGFHERVKRYPFHSARSAENVAMSNGTSNCVSKTAVDGWIQSPGHRKNLLGPFTHCGIGVYQNFDGAMYLTQLFSFTHIYVDGSEVANT
eukprot:670429_1